MDGGQQTRMSMMTKLIFFLCIAGTALLAVCAVWFFIHYSRSQENIRGRVVLLTGVKPPAGDAGVQEVRDWLAGYSGVLPGCLCALGSSELAAPGEALLFCIGYDKGDIACRTAPEKLPVGVGVSVSSTTNIGVQRKITFLLTRFLSQDIVDPRTDTELQKP